MKEEVRRMKVEGLNFSHVPTRKLPVCPPLLPSNFLLLTFFYYVSKNTNSARG